MREDVSVEITSRVGALSDESDAATADAAATPTTTTTTNAAPTDADATAARDAISHWRHATSATPDARSNANGW